MLTNKLLRKLFEKQRKLLNSRKRKNLPHAIINKHLLRSIA